jgi:hypothetical protein
VSDNIKSCCHLMIFTNPKVQTLLILHSKGCFPDLAPAAIRTFSFSAPGPLYSLSSAKKLLSSLSPSSCLFSSLYSSLFVIICQLCYYWSP